MAKPKGDDSFDQSKRAENVLAKVLEDEINDASGYEQVIGTSWRSVPVADERKAAPILTNTTSKRTMSRMLFITQESEYLDAQSAAINAMYKLAILFDEVHLMVLLPLRAQQKTKRLADNFWLYRAEAQYPWQLAEAAHIRAEEELNFSDGFRPDFIVAADPFEAGVAAMEIAKTYDRPYQVHVQQDFFQPKFFGSFFSGLRKKQLAKRVIRNADSVRAGTNQIQAQLTKAYKDIKEISLLPKYHSYKAIRNTEAKFDVHQKYGGGFTGIVTTIGKFDVDGPVSDTISSLTQLLMNNPKVGLLIIGEGEGKKFLEEKVKQLKIHKNVMFLPKSVDVISILKTSDVVVVADTRADSEDRVLSAAAAGASMVLAETNFRLDMFTDGRSASFFKEGDQLAFEEAVESLLGDQPLRKQYKDAAEYVIETRVEEDAFKYFIGLRDSLELTLVGSSKTENDNGDEGNKDEQS